MNEKNTEPNHLIYEKSPYLLQHAYNPVKWHPWSDEAFEKAKKEDKPIFLSIGYSTCHWCHVMEKESFENEEVASIINKYYIPIKVDREERPDIDSVYMAACQALTGSGGWPLTVFMTGNKEPFFVGTYFPKESNYGRPGLKEILYEIVGVWRKDRDKINRTGIQITEVTERIFKHGEREVSKNVLQKAYEKLKDKFDKDYGGFGHPPKFPTPQNLYYLLRYWDMTGNKEALEMVETTLESMYKGGIYDHIGFGFARYSTDREWLVPHFEKMLYDNALLSIAYLEAYQATGKLFYAKVAEEIFTYILRDMTSNEGTFYTAEDADSEGEEGKYYVWTPSEIKLVLGEAKGEAFCHYYNITEKGNFEGNNIPNLINTNELPQFNEEKDLLFQYRKKRVHPLKDDKVLTSWNGLMIAALAKGFRVLKKEKYIHAAEKAVNHILDNMTDINGRLYASYRQGKVEHKGFLEDYAYLVWGLIELFQANYEEQYLFKALELNDDMLKYFWDDENGGLFQYGWDAENLIVRPKDSFDGATPSGNSVAAVNMLKLYSLTGKIDILKRAKIQIKSFGDNIEKVPEGFCYFLIAVYFMYNSLEQVIITGEKKSVKSMLEIAEKGFNPLRFILYINKENEDIFKLPLMKDKLSDSESKAYVCRNNTCLAPINNTKELEKLLSD
ncbi:thioredoxin domain-containing protein [Methanosalsum natronophilum]|uniref:Thioredoxin domain-containing protein n=1 Tax=Methanosalsum natronophilum TaxID=768733 RepID=A0A424YW90_9EURY|nr:thioredoxin domain-containing protein [Methanosalsum natronophilum]MCS3923255.1 uncharacterized protein YyaL (SSP411 family) [Methanosalsum natronophilum]RQD83856.1 MAG: thioredoxin domain-containing protein [Methanosalsum natronophilum]